MIAFEKVSCRIDQSLLVRDLSFEVPEGKTLILLGRSGSGKTTTLKLINRLLTPTEGAVTVQGKTTLDWDPIALRRKIGYVIQEGGLFPHYTVEENVGVVPSLEGWDPKRIADRVEEVLHLVGLDSSLFARRFPRQLSGGQRQRVGVARALAADPPILLMDEPFGALDPITRAEIQREFAALQTRLSKTVVFVTHDVAEAFLLGSQIVLMSEGRILLQDTRTGLLNSSDPEARIFLQPIRDVAGLLK